MHTLAKLVAPLTVIHRVAIPPVRNVFVPSTMRIMDMHHGGQGSITGTVKDQGTPDTPVVRRVRLHRKSDGMLVRETWSAADGGYTFAKIAMQLYYVVSHDHTGNFNAVIKDSIMPEVA